MCGWCERDPSTGEIIVEVCNIKHDPVKKPFHYQGRFGLEAREVIRNFSACPEYEEGFYWGNTLKYLLRFHSKNGVQDLKKARENLNYLIDVLEVKDV